MDIKKLKEILKLVEKSEFDEIEIVEKDWRLRVERKNHQPTVAYTMQPQTYAQPMAHAPIPAGSPATVTEAAVEAPAGHVIASPFVGTFYRSSSPDAASFVDVGTRVTKGQTLCIVEAMKLMNEIESEVDGVIAEIYVQNAQPVEFGQKLFRIG